MIHSKLTALAVVAVALVSAACGGDSSPSGPSPAPQTGTITVLNQSAGDLVAVNFSQCTDPSWGPNRLGAGEKIAPGATRSWTVESGCYDVKASNGTRYASWLDRDVSAGGALNLAAPAELDALMAMVASDAK